MRTLSCWLVLATALSAAPVSANNWERFYTSFAEKDDLIPSDTNPEVLGSSGDPERDMEMMWRRGYAPLGYSLFNSPNGNTKDAVRFAQKLRARYVMFATQLTSSMTQSVPLTLPNTTTSDTTGTVAAWGGGQTAGTYSGTTTTYGNQTTYFPVVRNRFDKWAMYFAEMPKRGAGMNIRELTDDEVARLETRRALAVRFVRDNSPAYYADILPGDIITHIDGLPADIGRWWAAMRRDETHTLRVLRNGEIRELVLDIPPEWRPK